MTTATRPSVTFTATDAGVEVAIEAWELRRAEHVGSDRHTTASARGWKARADQPGEMLNYGHSLGAIGELVVAKWRNVYWNGDSGKPDRGAPDVDGLHVRTVRAAWMGLTVRPEDCEDGIYVLVVPVLVPFKWRIAGWCYGHEAREADCWGTFDHRPPAWWRPQARLHLLETLP